MAVLRLPRALRRRGCGRIDYVAERNTRFPVLLVHGYASTETLGAPAPAIDARRELAAA